MIPHILHYCWFGQNPLTPLAEQCLASWQEHMPDWTIMRWDEASLSQALSPRIGKEGCWSDQMPMYVRQAYEARKYAFVSDYVRLWALEQYGGVYVDTDVKVLKSYEPLLNDTAFIGLEESKVHFPGTCVMGCEPHSQWVRDMLALYEGVEFMLPDGSLDLTTNVERMGKAMVALGLNRAESRELRAESGELRADSRGPRAKGKPWDRVQYIEKWGLRIYTHDYFSPITSTRVMRKTKNTYSIHYFAESWRDKSGEPSGMSQEWRNWTITREIVNMLVMIKRTVFKS